MRDQAKFVLYKHKLKEVYDTIHGLCDEVSYSAKTNYQVGKVLEETTSCFFSVHTFEVLQTLEDKKRAWFFAQAWDEEEIHDIIQLGVYRFVVDNETDLRMLLHYIEKHDVPIELLLRMRLKERTVHTGKYFVYGFYSKDIIRLVDELATHEKLTRFGLHFHRKSQNVSEWSLTTELQDTLPESVWEKIGVLNIGGGLPVPYKNFRSIGYERIFNEIIQLRQWLQEKQVQLIIEPGRYLAAPCVELHATVKNVYDGNVIVNCSVYNTALDTFVTNNKLLIRDELESGNCYVVKGMTPCSMDMFRYRVYLDNPRPDDVIIFENAGAYNYASDFCNLQPVPTEIRE